MKNRYGIDELHDFMFKSYLILFIINIFVKSSIVSFIELTIVIIIFYRFFSKDIKRRRNENIKFLNIKNKLKNNSKISDGYIYKKCPKCKKLLKLPLPYKKGIKSVICPKCNKKFSMLVLKSEKVEIISNKK